MNLRSVWYALPFLGMFYGCGENQSSHLNEVINPIGQENLGYINIKSPKVAGFPALKVYYRNKLMPLNEPVRLLAGDGCITIQNPVKVQRCGVKVKASETLEFDEISALELHWDHANFYVNAGPKAAFLIEGNQLSEKPHRFQVHRNSYVSSESKAGAFKAYVFSGEVTLQPELKILAEESKKITLEPGEHHKVDLNPSKDVRYRVHFFQPEKVFEDIFNKSEGYPKLSVNPMGNEYYLVIRDNQFAPRHPHPCLASYSCGIHSTFWNRVRDEVYDGILDLGFFYSGPKQFESQAIFFPQPDKNYRYEVHVNDTYVQIDPMRGIDTNITVKRLDINHPEIEKEDGSTYFVEGTYQVYRKRYAHEGPGDELNKLMRLPQSEVNIMTGYSQRPYTRHSMTEVWRDGVVSYPTKTGIDLLPGSYKVVVKFKTKTGSDQKEYFVDL